MYTVGGHGTRVVVARLEILSNPGQRATHQACFASAVGKGPGESGLCTLRICGGFIPLPAAGWASKRYSRFQSAAMGLAALGD